VNYLLSFSPFLADRPLPLEEGEGKEVYSFPFSFVGSEEKVPSSSDPFPPLSLDRAKR